MAPPVRFSSGVTWSYLVSRSRSQRSAAAVAPMAGDWRGPGDPRVLPAGDTGQRALATPAQGRAPACVLPALSAFLLLVLSPPSILTPHWPLVAPQRLGPGGCGRPGWYSPGRGARRQHRAAWTLQPQPREYQEGGRESSVFSLNSKTVNEPPVGRAKVADRKKCFI